MTALISVTIVLGAFVLCILVNVLTRRIFAGFGVLMPKGIPVVGGLSIWGAFCIAACWGASAQKVPFVEAGAILGASLVMLVFGIFDDQKEFSVALKFVTQIFSVSLLMYFGVKTQIVYVGPYINAFFTLVWVIGIVNAFNHLDISDGVAGFIGLLTSSAFLTISILNHDKSNAILSLALCGALAGFLVFNFPPAKIYMGNAGSHFLGFVFAAIAIAISYAPLGRKAALISPILILGLPILDTAFLILVRIWKRKIPFLKSNDHIILRLKSLGYSPRKIFLIMGLWGLFFVGSGVAVSQFKNSWGLFTVAIAGAFSFKIIKIISKVSVND